MELIEELIAERECRKLVGLYPQLCDDANGTGLGALFTDDGVLSVAGQTMQGPAAIGAWLLETLKVGPMRHLMMNPCITVESPDRAQGTLDMALLLKGEQGWGLIATARYNDVFVRTPQGWRFAQRKVDIR
jgi:hypothetical protein